MGEGGQAKVFKAKFHGKDVAMKYVPLSVSTEKIKSLKKVLAHVFLSLHTNMLNKTPKLTTYQKTKSGNSLSRLEREFEKWSIFGPIWP